MTRPEQNPTPPPRPSYERPEMTGLSPEEQRSVTHGEFWIPEPERNVYKRALQALNGAGIRYIISGLYAIYEYTGLYRKTKDLDLMLEPTELLDAARVLKAEGFRLELSQAHWIAKAHWGEHFIDLVFAMGNGLAIIDRGWYENSRSAILAATAVRVAPPEELIWHRLFITERHRTDISDVVHLIVCRGDELDWDRLLHRVDDHWQLLLAQVQLFDYVYPAHYARVPRRVREELYARARAILETPPGPDAPFRGTLVSRFSFAIDVNEWAMRDLRSEAVAATRTLPIMAEIRDSDVWDASDTEPDAD
ncbi:MAG: nucleotidyltransferase family protein [Longimicrobiales bacterium]